VRAWVASVLGIIVPMNGLLLWTGGLLPWLYKKLGQDDQVASWACQFYAVYVWSFPWYALYSILWKFCAAQSQMMPLVGATLLSTLVVLPTVLPAMIDRWSGSGAAAAFFVFYVTNCGIVVLWLWLGQRRPHTSVSSQREIWPQLQQVAFWKDVLDWSQFQSFMALGVGGMLAYLEWAYWEVLTLIIGTFGVLPLSAHTVPRQVTDIGYVVPVG